MRRDSLPGRRRKRLGCFWIGVLLGGSLLGMLAPPVWAQVADLPPLPPNDLPSYSEQERQRMLEWAKEVVRRLTDTKDQKALAELRDAVGRAYRPGNVDFQDALARQWSTAVAEKLDHANRLGMLSALMVTADLRNPGTVRVLWEAIKSTQPAQRYYGLRGLVGIRASLVQLGGRQLTETIRLLGDRGAVEDNPLVLREFYDTMNQYARVTEFLANRELATALLKVLETRIERVADDRGGFDGQSEAAAAQVAALVGPRVEPSLNRRLIVALVKMMDWAVGRYTARGEEYNKAKEADDEEAMAEIFASLRPLVIMIEDGESALKLLTEQPDGPAVAARMADGKLIEMKLEILKWRKRVAEMLKVNPDDLLIQPPAPTTTRRAAPAAG